MYRGKYSVASIIDIERTRKKKKSHRDALDQSTSFVSQEVEETAGQFKEAEDAVSVRWMLNNTWIQQQQRDCRY